MAFIHHILFQQVYPEVYARCLAVTAAQSLDDDISQEEIKIKDKTYQNLISILSDEAVKQLFYEKLDDVVIQIVCFCFDANDVKDKFNVEVNLPEPQPPFFSTRQIQRIINYIQV